jgi:hypothetical protein
MFNWLERQAARFIVWRHVCRNRPEDRRLVQGFVTNALGHVTNDIAAMLEYQATEAEILNRRLGRRYDPGMAVNEATERALKAKQQVQERPMHDVLGVPAPKIRLDGSDASWAALAAAQKARPDPMIDNHPTLSRQQKAALEFQKRYQRDLVERAQPKGDFQ